MEERIRELEEKLQKMTQMNLSLIVDRQNFREQCSILRQELEEAEKFSSLNEQRLEEIRASMEEQLTRALTSQTKFRLKLVDHFNGRFRRLQETYATESAANRLKLMRLKAQVDAMRDEHDEYARQLQLLGDEHSQPIENGEIREKFDRALDETESELDIFTPWMTLRVVDETMQRRFERLLSRGAALKIRYGIDRGNTLNDSRNFYTEQVADILKQRFRRYERFRMRRDDSRAKLFICDEKFYVISSFNILSNDAGSSGEEIRGELGEYSRYRGNLLKYREQYFDF